MRMGPDTRDHAANEILLNLALTSMKCCWGFFAIECQIIYIDLCPGKPPTRLCLKSAKSELHVSDGSRLQKVCLPLNQYS